MPPGAQPRRTMMVAAARSCDVDSVCVCVLRPCVRVSGAVLVHTCIHPSHTLHARTFMPLILDALFCVHVCGDSMQRKFPRTVHTSSYIREVVPVPLCSCRHCMCVFACSYIHVCVCVFACSYVHVCVCLFTYTCVCVCLLIHMYVCVCVCLFIYTCVCVCVCVFMFVCVCVCSTIVRACARV